MLSITAQQPAQRSLDQHRSSCSFFDLGSIDAFLITIPKSPKTVRLFLSGSELDEIHL